MPTPADVLADRGVTEITVRPIVEVLGREKPDVILLMSGANGFDPAARDRLIRTIGEASGTHLFVATIPPQKPPRAGWEQRLAAVRRRRRLVRGSHRSAPSVSQARLNRATVNRPVPKIFLPSMLPRS